MEQLDRIAAQMRIDIINMISEAGSGHPGGSLSCVDILTALYMGGVLNHNAADPQHPARDRFILAKGHAAPALYCVLAHSGYFPKDELLTLRKLGSKLQGHPDRMLVPGVEVSTGSLGQGLSIACGIALGLRLAEEDASVFTLLGDGECQEGQVWEAAMFAAHQNLDNLIAIVDNNGLQIDGKTSEVCDVGDISRKFEAFGWKTVSVDGHSISDLVSILSSLKDDHCEKPKLVLAHTVKGKGVSFMEGQASWHGKAPSPEQRQQAIEELSKTLS